MIYAINTLGKVDTVFFGICIGIVVACIAVYFLIPVFNHKRYKTQRENLRKRESAFRSNLTVTDTSKNTTGDPSQGRHK